LRAKEEGEGGVGKVTKKKQASNEQAVIFFFLHLHYRGVAVAII